MKEQAVHVQGYLITVERDGDPDETVRALRSLLKRLLRDHGFRAVAVEPAEAEVPK